MFADSLVIRRPLSTIDQKDCFCLNCLSLRRPLLKRTRRNAWISEASQKAGKEASSAVSFWRKSMAKIVSVPEGHASRESSSSQAHYEHVSSS